MINSLSKQQTTSFISKYEPTLSHSPTKLRVLVLDEEIPYPPNAGKRIRTWNLLRCLARRHSITLLCYGCPTDPAAMAIQKAGIGLRLVEPKKICSGWRLYLSLLANLFSPHPFSVTKHYSSRFKKKLDALLEHESWDLIHCEWTPYARFIPRDCSIPVLITAHNIESEILALRARHSQTPIAKAFFWLQEWKMRRFERRSLLRASGATSVASNDLEAMRSWGVESISLVPNGVDLLAYSANQDAEREDEILVLGSLDWYPNADSLNYFIQEIFPIVREGRPEAKLRIVGRRPPHNLKKRCSKIPGVDFVGEVEDVNDHLARATVVVVPLRIGGGSRLKILEALAAGKAVVSTSIGAQGLEIVSGEHLIIADSPSEFAASIERLLKSNEERHRLGAQGRLQVEKQYGWPEIAKRLENAWHEISRKTTGSVRGFGVRP
jgi:polysaccharide biosynthesis protein PslH